MKLSIIIPVYNEERYLQEIVDRVFAVDLGDVEKEVVISDDGSHDSTAEVIRQLKMKYPHLVAYSAPINLGKGAAVRAGIALSSGEVIVVQDADLELHPDEYTRLLPPLVKNETRVVYGSRFLNSKVKLNRTSRMANWFLTTLTNLLYGSHLSDIETGYKMFYRDALDGMRLRCVHFDIEPELTANFLRRGFRIIEIPVSYLPRSIQAGKKISWIDGFEAIYTLIRCRLDHRTKSSA